MGRHTMTRAAALLAVVLSATACSNSHGLEGEACEAPAPDCRRQDPPGCCAEAIATATCVDGAWRCEGDAIPEPDCRRFTGTSPECEVGPPPPDAGTPLDAGPPPDAGPPADCAGLGAAACFAELDCAPLFDDRCCPGCSPGGPCADCFDPGYVDCIPFDDCRAPSCGVVPSWGCFPSAPDCSGAVAHSLDGCSEYGCVPSYPPGEGDPSLDDAVCVPITGQSCTVACRRLPPTCPSGTVPEGDGSCYTDRCIPAFVCE